MGSQFQCRNKALILLNWKSINITDVLKGTLKYGCITLKLLWPKLANFECHFTTVYCNHKRRNEKTKNLKILEKMFYFHLFMLLNISQFEKDAEYGHLQSFTV